MFNKFDLAYAAGYIDGDGCLYIGTFATTKGTTYEFSIQVSSVKKESTDWLKKTFGGSTRSKETEGNRRTPHVWTIKGKKSLSLAEAILPYLVDKNQECQIFIEFALSIINNNFQPLKDEGVADRVALIERIREIRHHTGGLRRQFICRMKGIYASLTPTDLEVAYMAGLIDAEGCFRVKKWSVKNKPNPVFAICLEIGNTKKAFFEWILMRFGGTLVFVEAKTENRKHSCIWTLSSKRLNFFINRFCSYLKIKKPVCEKIIEFFKTNLPNGGDRHSDAFKKTYSAILEVREKIISDIHSLNAKGHNPSDL
jgi:hypothetical protein